MPSYCSNSAMRNGLEAQFSFMTDVSRHATDAVRKLSELHIHASQQLLQDSVQAARQVLACHDPLQAAAALVTAGQSGFEHWRNYHQQLFGMFSGVPLALTRQAETLMAEGSRSGAAIARGVIGGEAPDFASRANGGAAPVTTGVHHHRS